MTDTKKQILKFHSSHPRVNWEWFAEYLNTSRMRDIPWPRILVRVYEDLFESEYEQNTSYP